MDESAFAMVLKLQHMATELGEMVGLTEDDEPKVDGQAGEALVLIHQILSGLLDVLEETTPEEQEEQ